MMYASKTPRGLNRDPEPYRNIETDRRYADAHAGTDYYFRYDPRPEYDAVQHNEPNPILVFFREYASGRMPRTSDLARAVLVSLDDLLVTEDATPEQRRHARKVLSRLATLADNG